MTVFLPGLRSKETGTSRHTVVSVVGSAAAAGAIGYVVDFIVIPIVVHRVGAGLYGVWAAGAALVTVAALADLGVRAEIVRRVAAAVGDKDRDALLRAVQLGTSILAVTGVLLGVAGVVLAPALRELILPRGGGGVSSDELDLLIRLIVAVAAVSLVANGYFGVLQGLQRNDVQSYAQVIAAPVGGLVTLGAVLLGAGLWGLLGGLIAQNLVQFSIEWVSTRRLVPELRFRITRIDPNLARSFLTLAGLVLLSQVSDVIDSQWDKVVISHFLGAVTVTAFQLGTLIALQAKAVAVLPLTPMLTSMAELRRHRPVQAEQMFRVLEGATMTVGTVAISGVFIFGPAFVGLWLGPNYAAAGRVARLFSIAVAFNLLAAPLALRAFGEKWHRLPGIGSAVNIGVNGASSIILVMTIGLYGAIYGSIAGNAAGTIVFLWLMRRRMGADWRWPSLRSVALGVGACALLVPLHVLEPRSWWTLIVLAGAYALLLGALCALLEGVRVRDLATRWHR